MAKKGSTLHALLSWLNELRPGTVRSIDDLASGEIVWQVLRDIDFEAFPGELPSPVNENESGEGSSDHLSNLRHIYIALTTYIVQRCQRSLPLPTGEPNLEAIAWSQSEQDVAQLLKLVLLAAIFGRFSMEYIQQLTSFPEDVQAQFYLILEEPEAIEEAPEALSSTREIPSRSPDGGEVMFSEDVQARDPEIVYEERIADLVATNECLKHDTIELREQLENMHDLHTKLQKSYDNLEVQQQDTAERLTALRTGKGEQNIVSIQRTKMQQQEDVIASLEAEARNLQEQNSKLQAQTDLLSSQTEEFQHMQDELFEVKHERDQLQRKANAADKYKQKLQTLQKVEDENEALHFRVTEMQRQLKESDSDHSNISGLRLENDEFHRLVSNIEQELKDSIDAKKRAEVENITLLAKLQQADDQAARWHSKAEMLQTSLDQRADPDSPSTPRAIPSNQKSFSSLEDESAQGTDVSNESIDPPTDDHEVISEQEMQAIISIMRAHARHGASEEKSSTMHEQQKLATKIERCRADARESRQVIEFLAEPRFEFVGAKNLDQDLPYQVLSPITDDDTLDYSPTHPSVSSLSATSRRSSVTSFQSTRSTASSLRKMSLLRGMFGAPAS
jgi:protein HOOK3